VAQSTAGTHLKTEWYQPVKRVAIAVYADWDGDGDYDLPGEDITARVVSINIKHSLYDAAAGLPVLGSPAGYAMCGITLSNDDYYFSLTNPNGIVNEFPSLATDGMYGVTVEVWAGYYYSDTLEMLIQFKGGIETVAERERWEEAIVALTCRDLSWRLAQAKVSSGITVSASTDECIDATINAAIGSVTTDLDNGHAIIPYFWLDNENAWEKCVDIAASEGGFFFFGKDGTPTFRRITALVEREDSTSPVATINEGRAFELNSSTTWRDLYSVVIVRYTGMYIGDVGEVWQSPRYIIVGPGETKDIDVRFTRPIYALFDPVEEDDYICVTVSGKRLTKGVDFDFTISDVYAQTATLSIVNNLSYLDIIFPYFTLKGLPLYGDDAVDKRFDTALSIDKDFLVSGNSYLQTELQADIVGGYLRDRLSKPHRIYQWAGPMIPFIELLDRVALSHNVMTPNPGIDIEAWVLGWEMSFRTGDILKQSLILLPTSNVFSMSKYFILGESVLADSGSDAAGY